VYLIAEAYLDKPSATSFPRIPQCSGVHTSRTLLCTDSSFTAQTVSATRESLPLVKSALSIVSKTAKMSSESRTVGLLIASGCDIITDELQQCGFSQVSHNVG